MLILHGGGNMGDLYPAHDAFRQHITTGFNNRRIVSMPQSIHFRDERNRARSTVAYRRAQRLTLLARDRVSLDKMRISYPENEVMFCPDVALGAVLGRPSVDRRAEPLILERTDEERVGRDTRLPSAVDWSPNTGNRGMYFYHLAVIALTKRMTKRVFRDGRSMPGTLIRHRQRHNAALLRLNVAAATAQFSGRPAVLTDRLHAHILATLLGIPNVVVDNSYGKIQAVVDAYTHAFSTTIKADSMADGVDLLREIVS